MARCILLPVACAALLAAWTMHARAGTAFDVAPTTLDLVPARAGLFYVTNHGDKAVTVQLQAMDWTQGPDGDVRTPSSTLMLSPEFITIAPNARQSVRVMANPAGDGEHAYRLMVSELPDTVDIQNGVHVLLQFSVPVFVGHDTKAAPALAWDAQAQDGKAVLVARNQGGQAVKIAQLQINGIAQDTSGFFYVLPGASHAFAPLAAGAGLRVNTRDERSGQDIVADIALH